ncbi:MAG: hypothetical protein WC459_00455 [Patescibacteria group bacterium]
MIGKLLKKNEFRFIAIFLASAALFAAFIFLLAVIVDPHNDFGTELFKPLVLTNRTEKMETLSRLQPAPQAVIFGSSRVFGMDPEYVENKIGQATYNASVSYARPEDHWALLNFIVNDLKIAPKTVIVGLNLGEMNDDETEPQTLHNKNLSKYLIGGTEAKTKTYLQTFKKSLNSSYIRDIFLAMFKIYEKKDGVKFLSNGKIDRPFVYLSGSEKKNTYEDTYRRASALFENTEKLNPLRKLYLENFLSFANQNNIKVKLILLPMPEAITEKLQSETDYEAIYEEFIKYEGELASAFSFDFYDFISVKNFGGDENDFDDATHPGMHNLNLITEKIFETKK